MRTTNVTIRNRGLIALFSAAALMLVTASPSLAAKTIQGSGVGAGTEDGGEITQTCPGAPFMGTLASDKFDLTLNGQWAAVDQDQTQTALYVGVSTLTIHIGTHVISPEGTYTQCGVPLPVNVKSWSVTSPGGPNGVQCAATGNAANPGLYERRATSVVAFELDGQCTIQGTVFPFLGKATSNTTILVEGEMHPCDLTPTQPTPTPNPACTVNQNASSNLFVTWQAAGATP